MHVRALASPTDGVTRPPLADIPPHTDLTQTVHNNRSKHGAHISISDDNHHVTDAISSLYDYDGQQNTSRPLSFLPSVREEIHLGRAGPRSPTTNAPINPSPFNPSAAESRSNSDGKQSVSGSQRQPNGLTTGKRPPGATAGGEPVSPVGGSPSLPAAAAETSFPINNIDYESSPAAVAQELSNLQALRRMSMNVDATGDPDLPSFAAVPPGKSEDDPSRLFWVPARLHPELAPKEFKTFLDSRVESMKRRSGEFNVPNEDGVGRSPSGGGLRRTKSRLSRQIDNTNDLGAEGYHDGSEVLDRKRSGSSRLSQSTTPGSNLRELETLMEDPSKIIGRLSLESGQQGPDENEDMPIVPHQPGSGSLKRSTRTTYRKGSLRRGERVQGSRRHRTSEQSSDEVPPTPPLTVDSGGLQRSMTDPTAKASNFSRPRDRGPSPPSSAGPSTGVSFESILSPSHGRSDSAPAQSPTSPQSQSPQTPTHEYRDRSIQSLASPQVVEAPPVDNQRLSPRSQRFVQEQQRRREQEPEQTFQSLASNPAPLPGNNIMRTNDLSVIPTLPEEKRAESKKSVSKKRSNDGNASSTSSAKKGWSWGGLLGESKDKERRKKKEDREAVMTTADDDDDVYAREKNRRAKRNADPTRLDLLQQQIDSNQPRGRESLVLDRDQIRLEEARSNERNRKPGKEKDGLLAQIFGKKSRERDAEREDPPKRSGKTRPSLRPQSPEPAPVALVPDVDYNWTRFSILEERAIYRMAHIKLANPRRELRSQVLLSNFMYDYLAKVQQMHPQLQIPQSAAQRKQQERQQAAERERQRKEGTPEEYYQYQRYQEQLQAQDAAAAAGHEGAFVEDQGYDYGDNGYHEGDYNQGYEYSNYSHEQSYQYQQGQFDDPGRRDDDDDMW